MEYNTITINNTEYYLVPKPVTMNLTDSVRIKFIKRGHLKNFDVELDGYHKPRFCFETQKEYWTKFVRHEKEDGSYWWCDWYNSYYFKDKYLFRNGKVECIPYPGFKAHEDITALLENWYQNNAAEVRQ